jgi:hypothetical protein
VRAILLGTNSHRLNVSTAESSSILDPVLRTVDTSTEWYVLKAKLLLLYFAGR